MMGGTGRGGILRLALMSGTMLSKSLIQFSVDRCGCVPSLLFTQKNIYFCFIDYVKAFDCMDHNKLENSETDGNTRPPDLPLEKSMQARKQQLELDREQQTDSK